MNRENDGLERLQAEIVRARKLAATLGSLREEREELAAEERRLAAALDKEQRDVEALRHTSFTAVLSALRGDKEERLAREQAEMQAAALRHGAARRELERLEADMAAVQTELASLAGCKDRYAAALRDRLAALRMAGGTAGQEICRLEERAGALRGRLREIDEAVAAGCTAQDRIASMEVSVRKAANWGVYDMLGGGFFASAAKHSHLDDVERQMEGLQHDLNRLRAELADVRVDGVPGVGISSGWRFADVFFDGFFVDWAVQDMIHSLQTQLAEVAGHVRTIMARLTVLRSDTETALREARQELEKLATAR